MSVRVGLEKIGRGKCEVKDYLKGVLWETTCLRRLLEGYIRFHGIQHEPGLGRWILSIVSLPYIITFLSIPFLNEILPLLGNPNRRSGLAD